MYFKITFLIIIIISLYVLSNIIYRQVTIVREGWRRPRFRRPRFRRPRFRGVRFRGFRSFGRRFGGTFKRFGGRIGGFINRGINIIKDYSMLPALIAKLIRAIGGVAKSAGSINSSNNDKANKPMQKLSKMAEYNSNKLQESSKKIEKGLDPDKFIQDSKVIMHKHFTNFDMT